MCLEPLNECFLASQGVEKRMNHDDVWLIMGNLSLWFLELEAL